MQLGVSVLICCYNSAKRLPETLHHLIDQKTTAQLLWEVVLVDNNSSDNTSELAMEEWAKYNSQIPLIAVKQPIPGLSFAREKGLETAKYEYIIFCDDDNWLDNDYVQKCFDIFTTNKEIGIIGGRSTASFEGEAPAWFEKYAIHYAVGGKKESGYLPWVAGAGLCIKLEVFKTLKQLGFKPLLSGRKGKMLTSGEDAEICYATLLLGYKIFYCRNMQFVHFMPKGRLSWRYFNTLFTQGLSKSQVILDLYQYILDNKHHPSKLAFKTAYSFLKHRTLDSIFKKANTPKLLFRFTKSLFMSREGNDFELKNKYHFNRYMYVIGNKNKLKEAFCQITGLMNEIIKYQNSSAQLMSSDNG